jgi:excisionase family DNA binding protein
VRRQPFHDTDSFDHRVSSTGDPVMAGRMLRVVEVAGLLSCSERTVRRWVADGTLSSVKLGGTRLIPEADLDRLLGLGEPAWLKDLGDLDSNLEVAGSDDESAFVRSSRSGGSK